MKIRLTVIVSTLIVIGTALGMTLAVVILYNSNLSSVKREQDRIVNDAYLDSQNFFIKTIHEIGDVVNDFAMDNRVKEAIIANEKIEITRLFFDLNMKYLPYYSKVLYLSRYNERDWIDAYKFSKVKNSEKLYQEIEAVDASIRHRFISIPGKEINSPLFLYSSKISHPRKNNNIGAVRVGFDFGTNSKFIKDLQEIIDAKCLIVSLRNTLNTFGSVGPGECVKTLMKSMLENKNYNDGLTRDILDEDLLSMRAPLSTSARFENVYINAVLVIDPQYLGDGALWKMFYSSGIALAVTIFVISFAVSQLIKKSTRELVEFVGQNFNSPLKFDYSNSIVEFQVIADTYRDIRERFLSAVSDREKAETNVESLSQKLVTAQLQKMEALGTLTAGVAHDFNNILAIIRGNMDLIQAEKKFTKYIEDRLSIISHVTNRATGIVKNLLLYVRNDDEMMQSYDLKKAIYSFTHLLPSILGPRISIKIDIDKMNNYPVYLDIDKYTATLMNLAKNARDAMPDGGEFILSLKMMPRNYSITEKSASCYCVVSIVDTGGGIDDNNLKKIFDPFFTTKDIGHGTGLGLSMVYEFVEQSRGKIDVVSKIGSGTKFDIILPLNDNKKVMKIVKVTKKQIFQGMSILVVDDEPFIISFIDILLTGIGVKVKTVGMVAGAVELLSDPECKVLDWVITDMQLTDGMGSTVIEAVKKYHPHSKILIISGYNVELNSFRTKADTNKIFFLQKPFSTQDLLESLAS